MNFDLLFDQFFTYTVTGLNAGAIYALVALGYTLVYGVLRLINFAHSEVFMVGTFGALFASKWLGIGENDPAKTGMALIGVLIFCTLVAMIVSGAGALVLEQVAYRPLRKRGATRLAALISAIGASFAIAETIAWWRGRDFDRFPGVFDTKGRAFKLFDANVRWVEILVVVAAVVMMVALDQFVNRTRLGRGIRAVAQDQETAQLMGVNVDRVILLTFLLGGLMAGGAASLYMVRYNVTKYSIGFLLGVKAFTAAVLGGIGNLRGALLGGLALGLIENYGAALTNTKWQDPIAFAVLLVVLMFRPTGLLGEKLTRARA